MMSAVVCYWPRATVTQLPKKTAADGGEKKQVKGIYAAFKSRTNKWNYEEKKQITGDDADQL